MYGYLMNTTTTSTQTTISAQAFVVPFGPMTFALTFDGVGGGTITHDRARQVLTSRGLSDDQACDLLLRAGRLRRTGRAATVTL